jgi:hypothetical protein
MRAAAYEKEVSKQVSKQATKQNKYDLSGLSK